MFTHVVFWPWLTGVVFLVLGLAAYRRELAAARGFNKWIELGPVFVAAPLAGFAAEHAVIGNAMQSMVPGWLPWHLFWVYFVGCAWLATSTSLVSKKWVRLAATLMGVMFLLLVSTSLLPGAIANPGNRVATIVVFREMAFAGGAWALAGGLGLKTGAKKWNWMVLFGRFTMALAVIFFGIQEVLHPQFTPGVPDDKLTPLGIPLHAFWGYPSGIFLVVAGMALLIGYRPRIAAGSIGVFMTLLTVFFFLPILLLTRDVSEMLNAFNFVADTLMFGGTALLVAGALGRAEVLT